MSKKQLSRGLRNNNPGNIDFNAANNWQGQIGIETDVAPGVKPRFAKFKSMEYGVRALAVLCVNYYDKHGADTLSKFFGRYAPSVENNTRAYAIAIAADLTRELNRPVTIYDTLDLHDYCTLRTLVCGIIEHENGAKHYADIIPDATIDKGMTLAGVEPPKKPLAKTGTMKTAGVVGSSGVGAILAGVSKTVEDHGDTAATAVPIIGETAQVVEEHYTGLFIMFGVVVVAAAVFMAYSRWKDRKLGVR